MGIATREDACGNHLPIVINRMRNLKGVAMDHVTAANEHLSASVALFNVEQRHEIAKAIKAVMQSDCVTPTTKHGVTMQTHMHLHEYMPAKLWAILSSTEPLTNKFKHLASFMVQNLGLRHPCQQTKKSVVVTILVASDLDPDPQAAYGFINDFSEIVAQKRSSIPFAATMVQFPQDPQKFIRVYPGAYGDAHPPVASRVDESVIRERSRPDITPCRSSNKKVSRNVSQRTRNDSMIKEESPDTSMNGTLLQILQHFMMGKNTRVPDDIQLHYANAQRASGQHAASSSSTGPLLAITDADASASGDTAAQSCIPGGVGQTCLATPPLVTPQCLATAAQPNGVVGSSTIDKLKSLSVNLATQDDVAKATAQARVLKRPGSKSLKMPLTKSSRRADLHKELLARPPASPRPAFSKGPTFHHGGRISWVSSTGTAGAFRIVKRKGDKTDVHVNVDPKKNNDVKQKFALACAIIEDDERPSE